ncbi:MAG: D-alanyl-D-alanine carboxypeptidase [Pseudoflavonifractor sp.]|nr:D-alanyl-D-alanine carboxypeptidase [Pseudoflavonifractor sp.]
MKKRIMIYRCLVLVAALVPMMLSASKPSLTFKGGDQAAIGIYIAPIGKEPIVADNASRLLVPASTTKCVTAAACVLGLPSDFRFETSVWMAGTVDNGKLCGNLVIDGCGDPTLESSHFQSSPGFVSEIYDALNRHGVSGVSGSLVIDTDGYPAMGYSGSWMVEDIGCDYGAGLYGFNYRDNTVRLTVAADGSVSCPVSGIDAIDMLSVCRNDVNSYPVPELGALLLYGSRPKSGVTVSATVANPSPYLAFATELETVCQFDNEEVTNGSDRTLLTVHRSPSRDEILRSMMVRSDNLYAEGMLRALVSDSSGIKSASRAIEVERRLFAGAGIDMSGQKVVDGSGLARNTLLSPLFMGGLLSRMSDREEYVSLFPKVGREGTVKRLLNGTKLDGRLALKSGSMGGVLCYAGYKTNSDGRPTHVVVIMVNNFLCKPVEIRKAVERYLLEIF